jgi:chromosome segregation ATPase
VLANELKAA